MPVMTLNERTLVVGAAPVGLAYACGHGGRFGRRWVVDGQWHRVAARRLPVH
ncbi:MAG: hypothetical protein ACPGWQ_06225 [Poseidonia sp.]